MTVPNKKAPANYVPAAAVKRRVQALSGITGCKGLSLIHIFAQVKKYFGDKVYRAVIPRTVHLSEAPSFGMPINFYEPNGRGSEAYMELAREFLANNER